MLIMYAVFSMPYINLIFLKPSNDFVFEEKKITQLNTFLVSSVRKNVGFVPILLVWLNIYTQIQ